MSLKEKSYPWRDPLSTVRLILPALIPSWRFFDVIKPSPRIEYTLLAAPDTDPTDWVEFRPRPPSLSARDYIKRLFYNADWNENLFLVSCAERLIETPTRHSVMEIRSRIEKSIRCHRDGYERSAYLQFRLVFLYRTGGEVEKQVAYCSDVSALSESKPA